jgi:hypothetical protein
MTATLSRKAVLGLAVALRKSYSLCDIAEHPQLFCGRNVAVKGTLYGYFDGLIHLSATGCEETSAWATVEVTESFCTDTREGTTK